MMSALFFEYPITGGNRTAYESEKEAHKSLHVRKRSEFKILVGRRARVTHLCSRCVLEAHVINQVLQILLSEGSFIFI